MYISEALGCVETRKIYSDVPAAWEVLVDYGLERDFQLIQIINTCDEPVEIRFKLETGAPEFSPFLVPAGLSRTLTMLHKGVVEWRVLDGGTLPTEGRFILTSI